MARTHSSLWRLFYFSIRLYEGINAYHTFQKLVKAPESQLFVCGQFFSNERYFESTTLWLCHKENEGGKTHLSRLTALIQDNRLTSYTSNHKQAMRTHS